MIEVPGDSLSLTEKKDKTPDLFEPILAYRHWDVKLFTGQLKAPMHNDFTWTDGENVAWCERGNTSSVECKARQYCACGFYGVYDDGHQYAYRTNFPHVLFGVIAAYGTVTIGTRGLRCSKAKIVALHLPYQGRFSFNRSLFNMVRQNYPSVRLYRNRVNLITQENVHLPKELMKYQRGEYG